METLPVYKAEDLVETEKIWGDRFKTYLYFYERDGKLEGRKYKAAFSTAVSFDLGTGQALAQRPHAIYEFTQEFRELEDKFYEMVEDIFENLSEEDKDLVVR